MKLTDLQWELNRVLDEYAPDLDKTQRQAIQKQINIKVENFGRKLIESLGVSLGNKS